MKLTVIMLDRYRTEVAIIHENQHVDYGRRVVQIELTEDQLRQLAPRNVGQRGRTPVYEEYGPAWLEDILAQPEPGKADEKTDG